MNFLQIHYTTAENPSLYFVRNLLMLCETAVSIDNERRELEAWFAELAAPNQKLASLCIFLFRLEKSHHS